MKASFLTAGLIIALVPAAGMAKDDDQRSANHRPVTLQGCVVAGLEKGTAALTSVTEIAQPGKSVMPAEAHGRQVVFWLMPDDQIVQHVGQMVQVHGETTRIEKSEIELKEGHQKSGGLVAKFEGPGKDVKVPNAEVGGIGTAGRVVAKGDDVKTFLIRVKVDDVRALGESCR
jgi:hypothetical protein